jgi:glyoxylase-like metal-dependent hydrolase (beta-lactamase superfamily II)
MPDSGTGRCDFPAGSADTLFESIQKIYKLPDATRIFTCHDYQPNGRPLKFQSTVGEQKQANIQLKGTTTKSEYVSFRTARDKTLSAPRLLLPSIQVNIDAGRLPVPESNGVSYLKMPLKGS